MLRKTTVSDPQKRGGGVFLGGFGEAFIIIILLIIVVLIIIWVEKIACWSLSFRLCWELRGELQDPEEGHFELTSGSVNMAPWAWGRLKVESFRAYRV